MVSKSTSTVVEPIKGEEAICAFSKQENTVGRQREMEFVG